MDEMKLHKNEIQIEALDAVPVIDGEAPDFIKWYKIEPDKITICRHDMRVRKDITEEFDIRGVKLSGVPAGYFSNKSLPSCDSPVHENDRN